MLTYKRIFISLSIVLLFALLIQSLRMNTLIEWSKAINTYNAVDIENAIRLQIPILEGAENKYILYSNKDDLSSNTIVENIERALNFMKKDYIILNSIENQDLSIDKTLIIATKDLDILEDITIILEFLESGGNVIFARSLENDNNFHYIKQKLGIYESGYLYNAQGINLDSGVLLGGYLDISGDWLTTSSLSVRLNKESNILARAQDGNPLFWEVAVGKGKAIVFNNTFLSEKTGIGIFTAALARAEEAYIYPILNAKVVNLNYFPLDLKGNDSYMKANYGRNIEGFIRDIWWPDMAQIASAYDLKYTSFFISTLEVNMHESFLDNNINSKNLSFIGREILRYNGEIASSGYNPIPLVFNKNRDNGSSLYWEDIRVAERGFVFINEILKTRFQKYAVRSYSPPGGMLSTEGFELVEKTLDDLAVINGLYEGDKNTQFIQDFEVGQNNIINFPTVSNGFSYSESEYWKLVNTATSLGAISHTLDVREAILIEDGFMDWKNLGKEFENFAEDIFNDFRWISSRTISQGAEEIKRQDLIKPYIFKSKSEIQVYNDNFIGPMSFILRYEKEAKALKGCNLIKLEEGFYLVNVMEPIFSIRLGG